MQIILNGDPHEVAGPLTLNALLAQLNIDPRRVAVEHNLTVVKRANYDSTQIQDGDQVEIVNFVGGGSLNSDPLVIAGREFASRLIVGTGKYPSFQLMQRAHEASGADMVTVAVRRVNISDRTKESLLDYIDTKKIALLPNTAGCYSADDAVRTARLGREAGLSNWVKLEVIGDERTLFPDNEELLVATKILVKEGFVVLPYTTDDPIACRKLQDAGAAAVMPLGAPIGSGLGIQNANNIRIIREFSRVPDHPGRGRRHCIGRDDRDGARRRRVLMNTAIAEAQDPIAMATSMKLAVQAGGSPIGRTDATPHVCERQQPLAGTLK
jgi:thiazole synthase